MSGTAANSAASISIIGEPTCAFSPCQTRRTGSRPAGAGVARASGTRAGPTQTTPEAERGRRAACDLGELPMASVPLFVGIEPADAFSAWLLDKIGAAR